MSKPMIRPDKGLVIHMDSIWADYCRGVISAESVSWTYLVGLDIFREITETSDLVLCEAVYDDTDGYIDNISDESGLIAYHSRGASEFRFWWAAHSRLDKPEGI